MKLLALVIGSSADANQRTNQSAKDGRYLCDNLAIAPTEDFVEADKSRGASGYADDHQPLKNQINFIREFHFLALLKVLYLC